MVVHRVNEAEVRFLDFPPTHSIVVIILLEKLSCVPMGRA